MGRVTPTYRGYVVVPWLAWALLARKEEDNFFGPPKFAFKVKIKVRLR